MMETKIFILLGILTLCVAAPSDAVESSTSTSVSVSTVTRKVSSRSFSRPFHAGPLPNDTLPTTEETLQIPDAGKHSGEESDAVTKPQKMKKKILASNLKNVSEKVVVFPGEKHDRSGKPVANMTEAADGGKPNSSDSAEDDVAEDVTAKSDNASTNGTSIERMKQNGTPMEARSLEDRSSEENVNVNPKAKTKVPSTTTARATTDYSYESFGGLQKVLNNNYLNNNEGYEKAAGPGIGRPPPPATLPAKNPPPISRDNSLKNAIRFEGEYYGPTGQTDWVPIVPDKLPVRHTPETGGQQHFGAKVRPSPIEKFNRTTERNTIVFPSDGVPPSNAKDTSAIPVKTIPPPSTTTNEQPPRHPTKFRGAVRYRSNSTVKFHNEVAPKRNISLEIPATGAPWPTFPTAQTRKSPAKPATGETTEISVVSSTNHTTRLQNAPDAGPPVPPKNVTEELPPKNLHPDDVSHNNNQTTDSDVAAGKWLPVDMNKVMPHNNDSELVVPHPVTIHHRNDPDPASTLLELETTSQMTTEEATATETTPGLTTLPKLLTVTTETFATFDTSSHTAANELQETSHADDTLVTTTPRPNASSTTLQQPPADDETTETPTEPPPTTLTPTDSDSDTDPTLLLSTSQPEDIAPTEPPSTVPSPPLTDATTTTTTTSMTPTPVTTSSTIPPRKNFTRKPPSPPFPSSSSSSSSSHPTTTPTPPATSKTPPTTALEPTEEGIYYKNYIPTTVHPHVDITEENVPAYLRLTVQARDWEELCRLKEDLRDSIMKMLGGKNVSAESVHFLNLNERNCLEKMTETRGESHNGTVFLPVNMFLMDKNGDFDKNLSEAFLTLWGREGLDFELPIRKVDFVTPIVNLTELAEPPLGGSVVAAIVISCVAGICVILLGVLFVIMKRRQKRFNYGQRCTPVSLDAYSLDSVSIYNSVRRKGVRASKRSYGNAAFDDPEVPTHPMNFAGLANFSSDKDQLYEEFSIIPQVYPKVEELPAGAETKNRYANIIPLPETRVHLSVKDGDALSDYINANYVRGLKGAEKLYIACQAPMESTVEDFWRMVWEQQCKVILMVTDLQENGIEKCADYLPPNEVTDNLRLFGDFQVTLKKRDVKEKYIISNLKLKNMEANLWREVTHLWYLGWPDQGVPTEANSLIAFLIEARSQMKIQNGATTSSPVVVHCSPGTGRTGTVIACDLCIREYEQSRMVDIPRCVFNLRRDRAGAVQTKDQYAFIYQVLNLYATKLSGGGIESI